MNEGDLLTYTATVTNHGSLPATNVVLTYTRVLSEPVSATPSTGVCSDAEINSQCALGTLAPGATATVQVVVRTISAVSPAQMTSVFGLTSDLADDVPANNAVAVATTVNAIGRVFTVTTTSDTAEPGSLRLRHQSVERRCR